LFLFLLIKVFLIINYLAYRWISIWRDFNQIKFHFVGQLQGILNTHDLCFNFITYNPDHSCCDTVVDSMSRLGNPCRASSDRSCYNYFLLILINTLFNCTYVQISISFFISELMKFTNSSIFILPLSPSPCFLTETLPFSASFSPTIRR